MIKTESRPCQVQGYEGEFVFRCYAQDMEFFSDSCGQVPVAIVENIQSGQVLSVYAGKVMFTTTIAEVRKMRITPHQIWLEGIGDPT